MKKFNENHEKKHSLASSRSNCEFLSANTFCMMFGSVKLADPQLEEFTYRGASMPYGDLINALLFI